MYSDNNTNKIFTMKEQLSLDEIKKCELDILIYIDNICRENNLRYYLFYGTLLGAIRHKKFIPWDDDIDIVMPREDYEKFISLFEKQSSTAKYQCQVPLKNGYFYEFAKVYDTTTWVDETDVCTSDGGLWVDIFPLDGLNPKDRWAHKMLQLLNRCRSAAVRTKFPHRTSGGLVVPEYLFWCTCRLIGYKAFLKKSIAISKRYKYDKCEYVGYASSYPALHKYMKKEWLEETIDVEFEGQRFIAPKDYHHILTNIYGDYMKLPPEDKRLPHPMKAYRR